MPPPISPTFHSIRLTVAESRQALHRMYEHSTIHMDRKYTKYLEVIDKP